MFFSASVLVLPHPTAEAATQWKGQKWVGVFIGALVTI
jgi:hypothetical protein